MPLESVQEEQAQNIQQKQMNFQGTYDVRLFSRVGTNLDFSVRPEPRFRVLRGLENSQED